MDLIHPFPDSPTPIVIAGPCSAESEVQVMEAARGVADAGVRIFRAGVWKPRTKPGGFEGVGKPALKWLRRVKLEYGLQIATEVANASHTRDALEAGVDILWIGARTAANPFAVQEIADTLAVLPQEKRDSIVVLVKNPVNPDLELWIGALERMNAAGIRRLGAIHRGFSRYDSHYYRNPPEWRIPIEMRHRFPTLPLICDPSHIAGRSELVGPLAQQALDLNFDGLMIECHCNPAAALSDSRQQLTPDSLARLLDTLKVPDEASPTESLQALRGNIDRIDNELLDLLAERMRVARDIGAFKRENNIPVLQPGRYRGLMHRCIDDAPRLGLSPEFVRNILSTIHEESVRQQLTTMDNLKYTPDNLTSLGEDEIFVFGSNLEGNHPGGAARTALLNFGAKMGQGVGLQGQSYAIPTMQGGVETIRPYVDEFLDLAYEWDQTTFYVTRIGCGIAGFTDEEIAPLFDRALDMYNVRLPESFARIIRARRAQNSPQS